MRRNSIICGILVYALLLSGCHVNQFADNVNTNDTVINDEMKDDTSEVSDDTATEGEYTSPEETMSESIEATIEKIDLSKEQIDGEAFPDYAELSVDKIIITTQGYNELQNTLNEQFEEKKQYALETALEDTRFIKEMMDDLNPEETGWNTVLSYTWASEIVKSDNVFCYVDEVYSNQGGAHPYTYYRGYAMDSKSGKELSIKDVIKDYDVFTKTCLDYVKNLYNNDEDYMIYDNWEDTVKTILEGNQNEASGWWLDKESLVYTFDAYILAPYAAGDIRIILPYSDYPDLFNEEYTRKGQSDSQNMAVKSSYEKAAYFLDMVHKAEPTQNTIVSPLSLDMALGLVSIGAVGNTKDELNAYLGNEDYGKFASEYMQYSENLNQDYSEEEYGGYKTLFEIANSVWVRDDRELISEYADNAKKDFQAEIASVSFAYDKKTVTVKQINGWCDEKTHGLIPSIISEDKITDALTMILINSLYFEAPWTESWKIAKDTFTDYDGNESTQDMLKDTLNVYYENDKATAFSKYYMNGLEFIGILPKEEGEFNVGDLDIEALLKNESHDYDIDASMPKLDFDTTAEKIIPILESQGIKLAFDNNNADFSGLIKMNPDENTCISDIIQKCKIELDENGTKAAAVTAIAMRTMAMPMEKEVKEVHLNRPFAFMIYDRENEQIVFMGKVIKP